MIKEPEVVGRGGLSGRHSTLRPGRPRFET